MDHLRGALRSATIWVNGLAGAGIAALPTLREEFPSLESYLSHDTYHNAMGVLVLANLALRVKTKASLAAKGQPRDPD